MLPSIHERYFVQHRLLSTYFEISNDRKRWHRLGKTTDGCLFTHRTERFGLLNSLHSSAGFQESDMPFSSVCQPALPDDIEEADIGFDSAAEGLTAMENEAHIAFVEDDENGGTVDQEDCTEDEGDEDSVAESGTVHNGVEEKLDWLVPEIQRKESTMDAFKRLTLQRPWIPFHSGSTEMTPMDHKEASLFAAMKGRYNRKAAPRSRGGYYAFMTAWNLEVTSRYQRQAQGESVILINRKSIQQLQEHYDLTEARLAMSVRVEQVWEQAGHSHMDELNSTLRRN